MIEIIRGPLQKILVSSCHAGSERMLEFTPEGPDKVTVRLHSEEGKSLVISVGLLDLAEAVHELDMEHKSEEEG